MDKETPTSSPATLHPSDISDLLFGTYDWSHIEIQSRLPGPDYNPKITTPSVGKWLKQLDADTSVFKIFIYNTHAEVWLHREWMESSSHYAVLKHRQEQETITSLKDSYKHRLIRQAFIKSGFPKATVNQLSGLIKALAQNPTYEVFRSFGFEHIYTLIQAAEKKAEDALTALERQPLESFIDNHE